MQRFIALRNTLSELAPVILKDGDEFDGRSAWNPPFYFHMMLIERLNRKSTLSIQSCRCVPVSLSLHRYQPAN